MVQYVDRYLNYHDQWGPLPNGSRSFHSPKKQKWAWVWPRDKKQKGAMTWSRFKDVLTCKGPDIWATNRRDHTPHRPAWTGWETDNLGYRSDNTCEKSAWRHAERHPDEKYDFNKRRYTRRRGLHGPNEVWADAKWSDDGKQLWYKRLANGDEYGMTPFDGQLHHGHNPFEWKNHSPWRWSRYKPHAGYPMDALPHAHWHGFDHLLH